MLSKLNISKVRCTMRREGGGGGVPASPGRAEWRRVAGRGLTQVHIELLITHSKSFIELLITHSVFLTENVQRQFVMCISQGVRERAQASNLLIGCPKRRSSK